MARKSRKLNWEEARKRAAERRDLIVGQRKPLIFVAMGMYRYPNPNTIHAVLRMVCHFQDSRPEYEVVLETLPGTILINTRTAMIRKVLQHPAATHLLIVDDDMDFPVGQGRAADGKMVDFNPLSRLLSLDKDMVGGLCFGRDMNVRPFVGSENEQGMCVNFRDPALLMNSEPFQVDFIGFGLVLISRKVITGVVEACGGNPSAVFRHHSAWTADVSARESFRVLMDSIKSGKVTQDEAMLEVDRIQGTAEVLGEDYSFCRLARKAGFEVWCDPLFDVHHYGEYPFGRNDWWFRHGKALAEKQKEAAAEV